MKKLVFAIITSLLVVMFSGCVGDAPEGYIDFEDSVVLSQNENYTIKGTDYTIKIKDTEKEKCVIYLFQNNQLYEKHFFEDDGDSREDFEFDDYKVRFMSGTDDYAKLKIYRKE